MNELTVRGQGIIGERPSRNRYKGHMDKAKGDGWGGVMWWGENGDNCTQTTIKKEMVVI